MYFHLEYLDRDALNRDFVRFTLEEDDVFTAQHTFAESFMSQDSNHTSRRITAEFLSTSRRSIGTSL